MKRTLTLRRETLTELNAVDLAAVAGGNAQQPPTLPLMCVISLALTSCGSSVNPKCPGMDA